MSGSRHVAQVGLQFSDKESDVMRKMLFAAVLGTTILATPAGAQWTPQPAMPVPPVQTAPQGGHVGGHMQVDRTRQQAQQDADAMFQRYDVNHDGVVTRDEAQQALAQWAAAHGGGGEGAGRAQRMLDRMFAGAPSATLQQFEAQALARFDRQDLNHDGVVTADERHQGWAGRAQ
jgi:hypothetical protein